MPEALAARRALEFARELCLFDVVLEGDCLRVIQALNFPEHFIPFLVILLMRLRG